MKFINRIRAALRRPRVQVSIVVDVEDALKKMRAASNLTIEQRIRIVNPHWTRAEIAAEAQLIRRSGGLS